MTKNPRRFVQRTALLAGVGVTSLLGFMTSPAEAAGPAADQGRPSIHESHAEWPGGLGEPGRHPILDWPW